MAKVMVVDDAMFMRKKCAQFLAQNGYEVVEAANGLEAVNKYQQMKPDAVLLDITMPDMDGLQTLKEILKIDPGAKVSMCSAMGQQSMVIEALKSGACDFVVKPFDASRVLSAVKKMVG
ncbi:MAG: response regulator [Dehalococcoidales bacterium]|nr:response regulator [Dehalococcoidales bacterium]